VIRIANNVIAKFRSNFTRPGWYFLMKLSRESFVKKLQTIVPKFSGNFRVKFWSKFRCRKFRNTRHRPENYQKTSYWYLRQIYPEYFMVSNSQCTLTCRMPAYGIAPISAMFWTIDGIRSQSQTSWCGSGPLQWKHKNGLYDKSRANNWGCKFYSKYYICLYATFYASTSVFLKITLRL